MPGKDVARGEDAQAGRERSRVRGREPDTLQQGHGRRGQSGALAPDSRHRYQVRT